VSIRRLSTRWFLVVMIFSIVLTSVNAVQRGKSWLLFAGVPLIAVGVWMLVREEVATRRR
jgi:hypothetical protein